jgi:hypothetical protein
VLDVTIDFGEMNSRVVISLVVRQSATETQHLDLSPGQVSRQRAGASADELATDGLDAIAGVASRHLEVERLPGGGARRVAGRAERGAEVRPVCASGTSAGADAVVARLVL